MCWIGRSLPRGSLLVSLLLWVLTGAAEAVVHTTGDGTGNTHAEPPADDPGIDNVGRAGAQSGVYIGDGWVLTADHVGPQDITLLGVVYPAIPASYVQLEHDMSDNADVGVYRIFGAPALPSLLLAQNPPTIGEELIAAGRGWTREPNLTYWNASWVEVTPPPPAAFSGYKRGSGSAVRWGRNEIDMVGIDFVVGSRTTRSFTASFDDVGGLPDEQQAVTRDSGGGVFVKRSGQWELAGIIILQLVDDLNQPADTAVFSNGSGFVDVSYYRDQILTITTPNVPGPPVAALAALALALLGSARLALRRPSS